MADEEASRVPALPTADLADKYIGSLDDASAPAPGQCNAVRRGDYRSFGPVRAFAGRAHVVACFRSNAPVRAALEAPGRGRVLVVKVGDPLAARRCAFLGDNLAALAVRNGWSGVVVAGCVRDSQVMRTMPGLGVVALGACPLKSASAAASGKAEEDARWAAADEPGKGVDLRPAADQAAFGRELGWAVVTEGDVLYVDDDGFFISQRVLKL
jgi:regulator of ribonuclease activity A